MFWWIEFELVASRPKRQKATKAKSRNTRDNTSPVYVVMSSAIDGSAKNCGDGGG